MKKGDKYNHLTAVKLHHKDKLYNKHWLFKCDCGNEKVINVYSVKHGKTRSCGCLQREWAKEAGKARRVHGMTGTSTYYSWQHMKRRCMDKNDKSYSYYGGRGITVCKQWLKFENFYKDMGDKPKSLTLERIDNNKNYEPSNCKWATWKEQMNNTRQNRILTHNNKTQTVTQWAEDLKINRNTLIYRIENNKSMERQ